MRLQRGSVHAEPQWVRDGRNRTPSALSPPFSTEWRTFARLNERRDNNFLHLNGVPLRSTPSGEKTVRLQKIIAILNAIICCILLFFMVSLPEMISKEVTIMTTAVRINDDLVRVAKIYSKIDKRSLTGQIEYWARIGKCAEENPDLTYSLIKDILIGIAELEQGESSEYKLG